MRDVEELHAAMVKSITQSISQHTSNVYQYTMVGEPTRAHDEAMAAEEGKQILAHLHTVYKKYMEA